MLYLQFLVNVFPGKISFDYFWFLFDLCKRTVHLKVNPAGFLTHNLQIMNEICHAHEILVLTTEPTRGLYWITP